MDNITVRIYSQKEYRNTEQTDIIFELTNQSGQLLYVLKWDTPLEGLKSDCLDVTINSRKVHYDGLFLKRGNPTPEDFVSIAPGASVHQKVDLGEAYDVSKPGRIEVNFKKEKLVYSTAAPSMEKLAGGLRASAVQKKVKVQSKQADFKIKGGAKGRKPIGERMRSKPATKKKSKLAAAGLSLQPCLFNGGTPAQQGIVQTAHQDGYDLTVAVLATMANDAFYKTWFGTYATARFNKVKDDYQKILNEFQQKTFTYDLTGAGCPSSAYAYTTKGGDTIWLCTAFWSASATGTDSKAGTMVHEHSHASAGTDDLAYGQTDSMALAISSPAQAIDNADSHEYYAKG